MLEIIENKEVHKLSLPLTMYNSVTLATARSTNDGEEFEIVAGLGKNSVDEIKKYALDESDEELQKNTGDRKRFGENSYESWYAKDRTPFGLIHKKTGALAAFAWFGPEPLSPGATTRDSTILWDSEHKEEKGLGEWHTIGYRSYNPFRGKGLMKDFSKFAMKIYSDNRPGIRYWAAINPENKASVAIASSLGLIISEKNSDRATGSLIMIKENA
ncbi:MAG: GNAT family N-acetyltransferase [Candidatus Liptonbacteria bacterium]|nr:GNAT family N-acetyltransferase [Candidatus Liptonbacteria bacterium]